MKIEPGTAVQSNFSLYALYAFEHPFECASTHYSLSKHNIFLGMIDSAFFIFIQP